MKELVYVLHTNIAFLNMTWYYIYLHIHYMLYVHFWNLRPCSFLAWSLSLSKWRLPKSAPSRTWELGRFLGLPGVDGTQNDSTRTAKNGAERTIIMGNSIAIYCLELVPQKKIFEIQIAHKVPATRTEVFIPSYSLKGKSMKIGLISIYQMLISGMGSLSRTPEHSKAT